MPPSISFQYRFHSAGQGLFASGTLTPRAQDVQASPFHWVFDCGSMSPKDTLAPAVSRYRSLIVGDHLDLLCLSHFDNDHVNGLSELLDGLHVGTVVMPYYSRLERLVLGSTPRRNSDDYMAFLANPTAFLISRAASIGQIITIGGPGENEDVDLPEGPPDTPIDPERPRRETSWSIKPVEAEVLKTNPALDSATQSLADRTGTTLFMAFGSFAALASSHQVSAQWEFLFFHKPIDEHVRKSLVGKVEEILSTTGSARRPPSLARALKSRTIRDRIKKAFVGTIEKGDDINSTSLCVYTGPLLDAFEGAEMLPPWPDPLMTQTDAYSHWHHGCPETCSLLYTGDANLKPSENREELRDFITPGRWPNIAVLQVPHHGSIKNWEVGAASEFSHRYSIFCADETRKRPGHPSREVIADLLYRGPALANKTLSWTIAGSAHFH